MADLTQIPTNISEWNWLILGLDHSNSARFSGGPIKSTIDNCRTVKKENDEFIFQKSMPAKIHY